MELQRRKVVIIGAGHVGSHAGYALLSQGLAEEIVYIDIDRKKAEAQALDLSDATAYLPSHALVRAGGYADAKDAQLLIVAAGPLPDMSKGQTRIPGHAAYLAGGAGYHWRWKAGVRNRL